MNNPPINPDTTTLKVAVATPVFGLFDYLPQPDTNAADYMIGQRVAVPFGHRKLVGIIVHIDPHPASSLKLKPITERFEPTPLFSMLDLTWLTWAARYYCHPIGDALACALPAQLRQAKGHAPTRISKWLCRNPATHLPPQAHRQRELLTLLAEHPEGLWQDTLLSMGFSRVQLRNLAQKHAIEEQLIDPLSAAPPKARDAQGPSLNADQRAAARTISQHLGHFCVTLLEGVTGSGKTEVYIEAVAQALKRNEQVLILVPEINLTPQTLQRFQRRLMAPIGTLHSGMSNKERADIWDLAKLGNAQVIIGTRSAIFTPFRQLGLIIIDEEHDTSYKQQDGFKYSARDLAVKRAQLLDIPILLGSATPSLESLYNVRLERYHHLKLTQRAGAGKLPGLEIIDVRATPLQDGLSSPLISAISRTLAAGRQIILFQNRRGYSPTLMCSDCGWMAECTQCDVRMTVHRKPVRLHCHHCDHQSAFPSCCPACKSGQLAPVGAGTERLEYALSQQFPDTTVHRMDRDTISSTKKLHQFLDAVNQGTPCIIIGTQMIAKGHDFRNVALVGIVDADGMFFSADFRAMERGAQLLLQVAGRAGRSDNQGRVLIQTRQPEHEIFSAIARGDYSHIAHQELDTRETCELPPYTKMISIRAEARAMDDARERLESLATHIDHEIQQGLSCQVAGPFEALIHRRKGTFRYYLHLYFDDGRERQRVCDWLSTILSGPKRGGVRLSVDIDPADYL